MPYRVPRASQKQGGADQVEHHIVQPGTHPLPPAAVEGQTVGSDEENFKEHKKIEQVAGEKGAVDPQQLQRKKHMKRGTETIPTPDRVEQAEQGQEGGGHQQQAAQTVQHQDDAKGRRPVSEAIDPAACHCPALAKRLIATARTALNTAMETQRC